MELNLAIQNIRKISIPVSSFQPFDFNYSDEFILLSRNIQDGKFNLVINSVRFILANILNDHQRPRNLNYAGFFELLVIGEFENRVTLVEDVANALTNFYIVTEILPRIRPINEQYLSENFNEYRNLIKKSVRIYDREENLF